MNRNVYKYLFILILFAECNCTNRFKKDDKFGKTEIELLEKDHFFGKISISDSVIHSYSIVNVGTNTLFIRNVTASCGCTGIKWAKEGVKPGDTTEIRVVFNPTSTGWTEKSIIVNANTDSVFTVLYLKGEVKID